ncbi:MAG: DUF4129 domain-containing protein [Proteobacteria bacterium]|nr:DUF4129 domain-containing protein [Pseudomonadota bacterium]MBU1696751.1 DUF4129 domain-containing protein [Pseudomonadota bacterium]
MSHYTHKRLVSACCGMDLCWLCAWANFLAVSTTQITFPLGRACAAFFMALFMSYLFRAKRYRLIWFVLGHVLGLGLMIWAAVSAGIGRVLPGTPHQWYQMALIAAMVCLFWYKGTKLSSRQMSYQTTCNYFDLGISLLFALLIIKMLIQLKGGIHIQESFTLYLMGGYFFFGLSAVFFSQNTTIREKLYLKGFRVYGVLISVFIVLLFCGMAMVFVLLPFMTSFAESGYDVLKQAAGPLSPYLIAILRFIFAPRNHPADIGISRQNPDITVPNITLTQGYTGWADHLFFSGIMAILFLIFVFMAGYIAYKIFKFLMSKQSLQPGDKEETEFFLVLIRWLVLLFKSFKTAILALFGKVEDAKKGFIKLISWGRKSGMPKLQNETPAEYAERLQQQFVSLENEIKTIIHAFHLETYGEMRLDQTKIFQMAKALKTIHSPLFWTLRIKSFWKML